MKLEVEVEPFHCVLHAETVVYRHYNMFVINGGSHIVSVKARSNVCFPYTTNTVSTSQPWVSKNSGFADNDY